MIRGWKVWMMVAALATAFACGSDESDPSDTGPGDEIPDPGGDPPVTDNQTGFVFDTITVPTTDSQAKEVALDIDGDGNKDNALGGVISTLSSFSDTVDVQGQVNEGVADGSIILLADLGYESFQSGAGTLGLYQGENPGTAPCDGQNCGKHLAGGTSFDISVASPRTNTIAGELDTGWFRGDRGTVTIPLPLGATVTQVSVIGAATQAAVSKTSLSDGILGGGITEEEINTKILPAVAELIEDNIGNECTGAAPDCCPPGSDSSTILDLFDENNDCQITADELQENFLIQTLLAPDLDLLDDTGAYNPGVDGVLDSVSVGIGYSGVDATFSQ